MAKLTVYVGEISGVPISKSQVVVEPEKIEGLTDPNGLLDFDLADGDHVIVAKAFGVERKEPIKIPDEVKKDLVLDLNLKAEARTEDGREEISFCREGQFVELRADIHEYPRHKYEYLWAPDHGTLLEANPNQRVVHLDTAGTAGNTISTKVTITDKSGKGASVIGVVPPFKVGADGTQAIADELRRTRDGLVVSLRRSAIPQTEDQPLWVAIRNRTKAISFSGSGFEDFINKVLCAEDTTDITNRNSIALNRQRNELYDPVHGAGAYELLRTATQVFLLLECGAVIEDQDRYTGEPIFDPNEETNRLGRRMTLEDLQEGLTGYLGEGRLPYINRVLRNTIYKNRPLTTSIFCEGILGVHAECPPMLELIWSYWHEEAMLVQTMNVISLRFQNIHSKSGRDPLAHLEIAPLYPVNNLLWGYLQDESHRLSVPRRNYEYNHHYGIGLYGQAVSDFRPADPRSKFLEAFHNLLYLTGLFYKQADDTTVVPDGFPILNALREVHLILAEGAHNQFGDLPWTARAEMLMQQWILARPEMREFLQSRAMVPYRETWMAQVDTMKNLQGWTDVSVTHFNFLAVYGEQILLSIRYGDWIDVADPTQAANWATYWRPEIQGYIHAYRAATGVDLTTMTQDSQQAALRVIQPSELLRQRLSGKRVPALPVGRNVPALPDTSLSTTPQGFRERRSIRRASGS